MRKNIFKDNRGDTNIISLLVLLGVAIALVLLFKPYLVALISSLF